MGSAQSQICEAVIRIFSDHGAYNLESQDGVPCSFCHEAIPIVYKNDCIDGSRRVDRSNRVDTDAVVKCRKNKLRSINHSYHIKCWQKLLWKN
jgi:hypothetical protein